MQLLPVATVHNLFILIIKRILKHYVMEYISQYWLVTSSLTSMFHNERQPMFLSTIYIVVIVIIEYLIHLIINHYQLGII